ncbi:MAG: hypothetical protein ACHP7N_09220 [Caulobacterales bacterium]
MDLHYLRGEVADMGWIPEHLAIFSRAQREAHIEATKELALVISISASPFLIGLVAFLLVKPLAYGPHPDASTYLRVVFLRGQLFLISVSFLSTSLHRLYNSDRSYRRPDIINIFAALLFGIIGVFYGINPSFAQLTDPTARNLSFVFFGLSLLFYYYTAVLAYERPPSVEGTLEASSGRLASRLATRRGGDA